MSVDQRLQTVCERLIDTRPSVYAELKFPTLSQPTEVGNFSLNEFRQLSVDRSELKFLLGRLPIEEFQYTWSEINPKRIHFDLNKGVQSYLATYKQAENEKSAEYIDHILTWLLELKFQRSSRGLPVESLKSLCFDVDFISWRGILTKIAATPYDQQDGWIIHVAKFKDVLFICEIESDQKKQRRLGMNDRDAKFTYWGHNFELFCVTDSPTNSLSLAEQNATVNCQRAYVAAMKSRLNGKRLLFPAEIDCRDSRGFYVELKTNRVMGHPKQEENFRRGKLLKWWLQSFLVNTPKVVIGLRDDNGIVRELQYLEVKAMPGMGRPFWSGAVCMNFLDAMLDRIQKTVGPNEVYRWEYVPGLNSVKENKIGSETDGYQFLHYWFCKEFQSSYPYGPIPQPQDS